MAAAWVSTITPWAASVVGTTGAPSGAFTPSAGNYLIVWELDEAAGTDTLSVTGTGSYTQNNPPLNYNDSNGDTHGFFFNSNSSNSSQTITIKSQQASTFILAGWAWEYAGLTSDPVVSTPQVFTNPGNNTPFGATGVTVPNGSTLLAICCSVNGTVTVPTISGPAGSTDRGNGTSVAGNIAYRVVEFTGSGSTVTPQFQSTTGGATTYVVHLILLTGSGATTLATTTGTWPWSGSFSGTLIPGSIGYPDVPRGGGARGSGPSGFDLYPTAGGGGPTVITGGQGTWTWAGNAANIALQASTGTWSWNGSTASFNELLSTSQGTWAWSGSTATFNELLRTTTGTWSWAPSTATFSSLVSTTAGTWSWAPSTASFNQLISTTPGTWGWNGSTAAFSQLLSTSLGAWQWDGSTASITTPGGATVINGILGTWTWTGSQASIPIFIQTAPGMWQWDGTVATFQATAKKTKGFAGWTKHHPERFTDLERRERLREAIESQFYTPEIQEIIAPYVRESKQPLLHPKLNWAQIYQNIEQIEQNLALYAENRAQIQRDIDDEDDLMELI